MIQNLPKSVDGWVSYFDHAELPVLKRTAEELARLESDIDNVSGRSIASVVLHDPLMTVKVLRYIQNHRGRSRVADITTIANAVMMLGLTPFFRHFADQPILEKLLADRPDALHGVRTVASRAFHAARYAQDWSELRHDMETEEVETAALLRDLAEILVWVFAPGPMLEIRRRMLAQPGLRSPVAQRDVLGFRLLDLQLKLAASWHLPKLLLNLMDEVHAQTPRARTVVQAVSLARHAANGWDDPALPDNFGEIRQLLGLNEDQTRERVLQVTLQAALDWDWYGVPPLAASLLVLPEMPGAGTPIPSV
jgi:HD-like signal output (HDOD) protein